MQFRPHPFAIAMGAYIEPDDAPPAVIARRGTAPTPEGDRWLDAQRRVRDLGPMLPEHAALAATERTIAHHVAELAQHGVTADDLGADVVREMAKRCASGRGTARDFAEGLARARSIARAGAGFSREPAQRPAPAPQRPAPADPLAAVEEFSARVAALAGVEVDTLTAFMCVSRGVTAERYVAEEFGVTAAA